MKKYQVIYADPPWRYDFSKSNSREIENHYPTMTVEDICNLAVPSDDNAVLYLWATSPKLLEALEVMKAWGFTYKSQAVWDKEIDGMGYWFRGRHEILLVGTKGKFSPPLPVSRTSSVIRCRRGKHSRKPDIIRDKIKSWFPCARLEMFCREKFEGWDEELQGRNDADYPERRIERYESTRGYESNPRPHQVQEAGEEGRILLTHRSAYL